MNDETLNVVNNPNYRLPLPTNATPYPEKHPLFYLHLCHHIIELSYKPWMGPTTYTLTVA